MLSIRKVAASKAIQRRRYLPTLTTQTLIDRSGAVRSSSILESSSRLLRSGEDELLQLRMNTSLGFNSIAQRGFRSSLLNADLGASSSLARAHRSPLLLEKDPPGFRANEANPPSPSLRLDESLVESTLSIIPTRRLDVFTDILALAESHGAPAVMRKSEGSMSSSSQWLSQSFGVKQNNRLAGGGYSALQRATAWDRQYHRWDVPRQQQIALFSTEPSLKANEDDAKKQKDTAAAKAPGVEKPRWTTTTNMPLPSRKLGTTPVPTPPSAPPAETNPLQRLKGTTPKNIIGKGVDLVITALKTVATFLIKLPGNLLYYATHPAETKAAWIKLRDMAKEEAHHYWVGTKLLWADIQTARKLLNKTLEGSSLTRRERKQLLRTVSDLFRLIPFSMFVLVPFMEFALPLALRLFPNMLPSTYQDSLKAEENMKRELKSRIAMAQFFQE